MTSPSELATLVETEARLDRALADARDRAASAIAAARQRAQEADTSTDAALVEERARVARDADAATAAALAAIEAAARMEITRFDALRGELLAPITRALVTRLVALALEGPP